jgi:hypothetical protein
MESKNYVIDGDADGIMESDFFSQLKSMMSSTSRNDSNDNTSDNKIEDEDNCCLLSKESLHPIHIVLECGHKFNYIPIYREIVAQKTTGPSSYYNQNSLKKNEIKCPYCRNVQGKLLPYLQYDGVKKMHSVNYPAKMSMTSQPCTYFVTGLHLKKTKKNASCKESAIECHNGTYVCKKHYELSLSSPSPLLNTIVESSPSPTSPTSLSSKCGVILRYGKNKGTPCSNPSSCRVHKKI